MSLLFTPVYANPSTPLWLSTNGGTISGNLLVDGNIGATGDIISETEVDAPSLRVVDSNGATKMSLANAGGFSLVQSTDAIKFTQLGTPNGNTTLTLSVAGANTDNLTVGGTVNCLIGPVPTQLITSTKTVNPVAISPAAPSQFGVDVSLAGISNAEYDVQATGTVFVASGTTDSSDTVVYSFTSGGGQGSMTSTVVPQSLILGGFGVGGTGPLTAGGAAANVFMRGRVTPNASGTTLGANVRAFSPNTSSAVYGATLTVLDVQRVR